MYNQSDIKKRQGIFYQSCTYLKNMLINRFVILGSKFTQSYIVINRKKQYFNQDISFERIGPILPKLGMHDTQNKGFDSCMDFGVLGPLGLNIETKRFSCDCVELLVQFVFCKTVSEILSNKISLISCRFVLNINSYSIVVTILIHLKKVLKKLFIFQIQFLDIPKIFTQSRVSFKHSVQITTKLVLAVSLYTEFLSVLYLYTAPYIEDVSKKDVQAWVVLSYGVDKTIVE